MQSPLFTQFSELESGIKYTNKQFCIHSDFYVSTVNCSVSVANIFLNTHLNSMELYQVFAAFLKYYKTNALK